LDAKKGPAFLVRRVRRNRKMSALVQGKRSIVCGKIVRAPIIAPGKDGIPHNGPYEERKKRIRKDR